MKRISLFLFLAGTLALCSCGTTQPQDSTSQLKEQESTQLEDSNSSTVTESQDNKLTRETIDKSKYTGAQNLEYAENEYRICGILGTSMNDSGQSHLSNDDYEFISSNINLFSYHGKVVYGYTDNGDLHNIIDLATWTTNDVITDYLSIVEPMSLGWGNDYRIGEYGDYADAYVWENIDGYEAIACCQNSDGTVSLIWNKSIVILQEPRIGMTADEIRNSTWGEPDDINKTTNKYGVKEQWVYKSPDYDYKYIYLEDGIVTSIQE